VNEGERDTGRNEPNVCMYFLSLSHPLFHSSLFLLPIPLCSFTSVRNDIGVKEAKKVRGERERSNTHITGREDRMRREEG
jgi:hypothetical protein